MVSVIIPNYNHSYFLDQRIQSVLQQTYSDFEVLILDDNSTDDSAVIIEKYRTHPKVTQIVLNAQNSGSTFKQWKKGIELAVGDWIWIAESDDFCEPLFLEELMNLVTHNPSVGLAYCQSVFYHSKSTHIASYESTKMIMEYIQKEDFLNLKLLPFCTLINASMAIFRRNLFSQIPEDYTKYKLAGDWIFWAELGSRADVVISGKFFNYFRQHDIKVSVHTKKEGKSYEEELAALQYFKDNLRISTDTYENAIKEHYLRFKKDPFPFEKHTYNRIEALFLLSMTKPMKSTIRKRLIYNKIFYKIIPSLLKPFKG